MKNNYNDNDDCILQEAFECYLETEKESPSKNLFGGFQEFIDEMKEESKKYSTSKK